MSMKLDSPFSVGFNTQRFGRIRAAMQPHIDRDGFSGFNLLVARRGRVVVNESMGYRDIEAGAPMSVDTLFRIYSMTKPVVCTALMLLFEEGRFRMADPLSKFIPAFGAVKVLETRADGDKLVDPLRPIQIHDLFTHTAGLTYSFLEDSPVCEMYRHLPLLSDAKVSLEEAVQALARLPLAYQPGSRWHYSVSIDVIGHLVEVLANKPLRDFLRERMFAPLGMRDTDFFVPVEKRDRIAAMYGGPDVALPGTTVSKMAAAGLEGYNQRADVSASYPADDERFARGGHGLFSTAGDYLRFAQMLLNGGSLDSARVLGRKTVEYMHINHLPVALLPFGIGGETTPGYGFGLGSRVCMDVGLTPVPGSNGEYGWGGAATTYYWVDPEEDLIGVMMAQYMSSPHMPDRTFQTAVYQALA